MAVFFLSTAGDESVEWIFRGDGGPMMEKTERYEKSDKTAVRSVKGDNFGDTYWADCYQVVLPGYTCVTRERSAGGFGLFEDLEYYVSEKKYSGRNIEAAAVFYTPAREYSREILRIGKQMMDAVLYQNCKKLPSRLVMNSRNCEHFLSQVKQDFFDEYRETSGYPIGMSAVVRMPIEGEFQPDSFGILWAGTSRVYLLSSVGGLQCLTEDTELFLEASEIHTKILQAHEVPEDGFFLTVTENVYRLFSSPMVFEKFLLKYLLMAQNKEGCEKVQPWVDALTGALKTKFDGRTDFSMAFMKIKAGRKEHLSGYEGRYQKLYGGNEQADILAEKILNVYLQNGRVSGRVTLGFQSLFEQYQNKKEELLQLKKTKDGYQSGFAAVLKPLIQAWEATAADLPAEVLHLADWTNHVQVLFQEQEAYSKAADDRDMEQLQKRYENLMRLWEQQICLTDAMENWSGSAAPETRMDVFVQTLMNEPRKIEEITENWSLAVNSLKEFERKCAAREEELQTLEKQMKMYLREEVQNDCEGFLEGFLASSELTAEEAHVFRAGSQRMQARQKAYEEEYLKKYQRFICKK